MQHNSFEEAFTAIFTPIDSPIDSELIATQAASNLAHEHHYLLNESNNPYCYITENSEFFAYEHAYHLLIQGETHE